MKFDGGEELPADLVVMAVGIRPNIELAKSACLACDRGILVDDTLQTYDPSIYAVGECVQHRRQTYGLVAPLWEQARMCAQHIAEIGVSRFSGAINATQLKVTGIEVFSAGDFSASADARGPGARATAPRHLQARGDRGQRVRGAVLFGDTREAARLCELITEGRTSRRCATSCCSTHRRLHERTTPRLNAAPTRTTCPYCGVGCGVLRDTASTDGVEVRGDPEHPANRGKLVLKGLGARRDLSASTAGCCIRTCAATRAAGMTRIDHVAAGIPPHHRARTGRTPWRSMSPASC